MERERDSFGILYTGYLLSIVKIKRERERSKTSKLSLIVLDKNSTKKVWQNSETKHVTWGNSSDFKRFANANLKICGFKRKLTNICVNILPCFLSEWIFNENCWTYLRWSLIRTTHRTKKISFDIKYPVILHLHTRRKFKQDILYWKYQFLSAK